MKIQNQALANTTLRLRSGRDAIGDRYGIFDVGKADAEFLTNTPGWRYITSEDLERLRSMHSQYDDVQQVNTEAEIRQREQELARINEANRAARATASSSAPQNIVADERLADENKRAAEHVTEDAMKAQREQQQSATSGTTDEGEVVDLEAMDKDQLLAVAEKYEVKVDKRWGIEKLREVLAEELFGDD